MTIPSLLSQFVPSACSMSNERRAGLGAAAGREAFAAGSGGADATVGGAAGRGGGAEGRGAAAGGFAAAGTTGGGGIAGGGGITAEGGGTGGFAAAGDGQGAPGTSAAGGGAGGFGATGRGETGAAGRDGAGTGASAACSAAAASATEGRACSASSNAFTRPVSFEILWTSVSTWCRRSSKWRCFSSASLACFRSFDERDHRIGIAMSARNPKNSKRPSIVRHSLIRKNSAPNCRHSTPDCATVNVLRSHHFACSLLQTILITVSSLVAK